MLKALKYEILRGVKAGGPAVPLAVKPVRVATMINEASFSEDQVLSHNFNVFLEDYIHDWNWDQRDGGRFRYYSRIAEVADVLIVYEIDKNYQPVPKFDPMTGEPETAHKGKLYGESAIHTGETAATRTAPRRNCVATK